MQPLYASRLGFNPRLTWRATVQGCRFQDPEHRERRGVLRAGNTPQFMYSKFWGRCHTDILTGSTLTVRLVQGEGYKSVADATM